MQLAQCPQHGLVAVRIVLDHQRRVLRRHAMQHFPDSLLVAALFRRQRDALHRRRKLQGAHVDMVLVVRVVQDTVELDLVDLRHRRDVSGHGAVDLDVLSALQHEQVADLEWLAGCRRRKAACRA